MSDGLASYLPLMAKAAGTSVWLSWLGMLLGIVIGSAVALMRRSHIAPVRWLALLYTEFWRSIPILIVMFFAYYGGPLLLGFDLSPFVAATLALSLHASASVAAANGEISSPDTSGNPKYAKNKTIRIGTDRQNSV